MTTPGPKRPKSRKKGPAGRFASGGTGGHTSPSATEGIETSSPSDASSVDGAGDIDVQDDPKTAPETSIEPPTSDHRGDQSGEVNREAESRSQPSYGANGSGEHSTSDAQGTNPDGLLATGGTSHQVAQQPSTMPDSAPDAGQRAERTSGTGSKRKNTRLALPDLSAFENEDASLTAAEIERWRYTLGLKARGARSAHDRALVKHREWVQEVADALDAGVPLSEIDTVGAQARYPVPSDDEMDAL